MKTALALLAVALPACSFGFGSAYVGQWRPRHQVDVEACLVDSAGRCTDHKEIATDEPARHFWGVILPFPAVGGASITHAGATATELRVEPSLEFLSGYGPFAWGVRCSWLMDGSSVSYPVTALGHLSLAPRLGIYAGAGYSPYATLRLDRASSQTSYVGGRVVAGLQVALSRIIIVSVEGDSLWLGFDGGYHSLGITGHLGLFL